MKHFFPILLAVLDVLASSVYFYKGDIPRGVYWLSAGVLTLTTIFIK